MRTQLFSVVSVLTTLAVCLFPGASSVHGAFMEGLVVGGRLAHKDESDSPEVADFRGDLVIGPGVEFQDLGTINMGGQTPVVVDVDFTDNQIIVTALTDQPLSFREVLIFGVDDAAGPRLTGMSLNPETTWAGFNNPQRLTFINSANFSISLAGLTALQGQQVVIDVVPEPASAALAGVGMITAASLARRRGARGRGRRV